MAPKSKSNKKAASTEKKSVQPKIPANEPFGIIINGLMKHGFSYAEAEKAVTQLWTEGYDIAETESAISLLVERLQCKQTKPEETKQSEEVVDETTLLQQKLQQVANLPDLNDVLDGLIRWFGSASTKEQQVLIGGDIIHGLLLRMLQTKNLSVKPTLLMSFFKIVFSLSMDISNSLANSFLTIYQNLPNLGLSDIEALGLFERILENLCGAMNSEKSVFVQIGNLQHLMNESKQTLEKVEGDDPKSQFMRRDNWYKNVKAEYDCLPLLASVAGKTCPTITAIPLDEYIKVPDDVAKVSLEHEGYVKELEEVRKQKEKAVQPIMVEKEELEKKKMELEKKKEELLKELEIVEKQLTSTSSRLTMVTSSYEKESSQFNRRIESLEAKQQNTQVKAAKAQASSAVMKELDALQKQSSCLLENIHELTTVDVLKDTAEYLIHEQACVSFLTNRIQTTKEEADKISEELTQNGYQADSTQNVATLRRRIANDNETVKSLRRFAQGIEKACSGMLTAPFIQEQKELVVKVYFAFYNLHVDRSLSDELYALFKEDLAVLLPKPVVKNIPEKKEEVKVVEEKPKVVATGKKWGAIPKVKVQEIK